MLDITIGDVVMYKDRKAIVRRTHALGRPSHCELVYVDTDKHQLVACKEMMACACKEDGGKICMKPDECVGDHHAHM